MPDPTPGSPARPVHPSPTPRPVLRLVAAVVVAGVAVTLVVLLAVGIESRAWRLLTLALACAAITTVVILVPAGWRARGGFITATFVGAAGVLPIFINDSNTQERQERAVNINYLGVLLREGPIRPELPQPLVAGAITDSMISDAEAARAVVTLQVDIAFTGDHARDQAAAAFIELYRTPDEAASRAAGRFETLKKQYAENTASDGDPTSFCIEGGQFWVCGGTRGYVYVEDTVSPYSNANRALASSTVGVILTYCDDQTLRAIT